MTTPQQPPAGGRGPQPGSAEAFIAAFGGGATDALKMLPGMLLRYLLPRLPVMGFIFIVTWLIHTFLVVYANEGFAPDTWLSPFLNVSGNAISSFLLYGFSSALLWSLLTSVFRMGPLGAITHFLTRPVLLYRQATANGRPGRGAFLLGTGAALTLNAVLAGVTIVTFGIIPRLNTPANFSLALGLTFFGMSRPGYLLAMFLSAAWSRSVARLGQQGFARTALNLKLLRGVIAGLAPGFLLAGILLVQFDVSTLTGGIINAGLALSQAAFAFLVGAALLYGAFVFLRGAVPPAQPPAPVAGLLILGTATAAAYGFLSVLFTEAAWADDGGWRESGSNLGGWITSDGALEAGVRGLPPGVGGAVGPLVPPLDGEEAEEPEPPRWALHGSGGPARLDGKPGASFTASFTVTTNDPEGDPAAAAGAMNFSVAGGAAEWFSVADDSQGGATRTLTLTMNEIDLTTLAAGAYALTLHASAPTPGGSVSASARCTVLIGGEPKLVHEFDGGKRAIVPDGRDQAVLKAKVVLVAADGTENPCDTATISFSKGNEWLDMSDPVAWDATWTAVALEASDPQGSDVTRQPPSPVTVSISATAGEQELSATASLELLGLPELDVDLRPDTVTLIQGENTPVTFKAFLTNPGSEPWQWELTLDNEQLGSTGFTETATPGVIEVAVTPPATSPEGVSGASVTTKLHIFARQGDKELERILPVILAREGLVVLPRGRPGAGRVLHKCYREIRKEIEYVV